MNLQFRKNLGPKLGKLETNKQFCSLEERGESRPEKHWTNAREEHSLVQGYFVVSLWVQQLWQDELQCRNEEKIILVEIISYVFLVSPWCSAASTVNFMPIQYCFLYPRWSCSFVAPFSRGVELHTSSILTWMIYWTCKKRWLVFII